MLDIDLDFEQTGPIWQEGSGYFLIVADFIVEACEDQSNDFVHLHTHSEFSLLVGVHQLSRQAPADPHKRGPTIEGRGVWTARTRIEETRA